MMDAAQVHRPALTAMKLADVLIVVMQPTDTNLNASRLDRQHVTHTHSAARNGARDDGAVSSHGKRTIDRHSKRRTVQRRSLA